MHPEYTPAPGAVAQPTEYKAPAPDPNGPPVAGDHIAWAADGTAKAPHINVLEDKFGVPKSAAATPVGAVPKRKVPMALIVVVGIVVVLGVAVGVYALVAPKATPVAVTTPSETPTPSPTPSTTPSPTPSATPVATPVPTPTPALALTVPTVAPTTGHPQSSVVTSASGLWLRSSATSVNKNNIIGWMPKGSTVSVDSIGDFWWHGVYKGQAGYFASKYTN